MNSQKEDVSGHEGFRSSRFLIPAVIVYVAATSLFLVWRGISVSPDFFVFILLFAAIVLGRFKAFVVDWLPFIALFLGYEFLRGAAGNSGIPVHYMEVVRADRFLGGGTLPTTILQRDFYRGPAVSPGFLEITATVFYFLHFAYPLSLGYLFWLRDRVLFRRFAACLLLMSFFAFIFFLLVPVAPPWLASQKGMIEPVAKIIDHTLPSGTTWFYSHLNPNRVAAFPSLHTAFPVVGMLYGLRLWGARAWPLGLWVIAVVASIVYLGEHYLVDALGGIVLAAGFFAALEFAWAWFRRRAR